MGVSTGGTLHLVSFIRYCQCTRHTVTLTGRMSRRRALEIAEQW